MQPEVEDYDDIHKSMIRLIPVILLGDTAVGKTNIIYAFTKEKQPSNIGPTIGVEYTSKTITLPDHRRIKTQIWDTAGQQQYRSVTMMNYRNAIGAIVVFDVTNRYTFQQVAEWIHSVREKALPSVQILLVGHKVDSVKRQISASEAQKFAKSENLPYVETTIKDFGTIHRAFQTLMINVAKVSKYYNPENKVNLRKSIGNSSCPC